MNQTALTDASMDAASRDLLHSRGYSDLRDLGPTRSLTELQRALYDRTRDLLVDHDRDADLTRLLNTPYRPDISRRDWSGVMNDIQRSAALAALVNDPHFNQVASRILGVATEGFPVNRFRACLPGIQTSRLPWHQDHATWYFSPMLTRRKAFTLWLSVNGSRPDNSIEVVTGSHRNGMLTHGTFEGVGYFAAQNVGPQALTPSEVVVAQAGSGFLFHPLLVHRSYVMARNDVVDFVPRYSVDLRFATAEEDFNPTTSIRMRLRRQFSKSQPSD